MLVQSAGVGVQVATQMRGAVCCVIALIGGELCELEPEPEFDTEPELDPECPNWPELLAAVPTEGVVELKEGAGVAGLRAAGADEVGAAAGLERRREELFAAGPFAAGFGAALLDSPKVVRGAGLAAGFAAGANTLVFPEELETERLGCDAAGAVFLAPAFSPVDFVGAVTAGALFEPRRRLNGDRTVPLDELLPSTCCLAGVAAEATWESRMRPPRTAASEAGSRIELNDERINCSST